MVERSISSACARSVPVHRLEGVARPLGTMLGTSSFRRGWVVPASPDTGPFGFEPVLDRVMLAGCARAWT